jgi:hypothetical protein
VATYWDGWATAGYTSGLTYSITAGTATIADNHLFTTWAAGTTSSATVTANVWNTWTFGTGTFVNYTYDSNTPTEEDRERWAERERQAERARAERELRAAAATIRAEETLHGLLDDAQWASWCEGKQFSLITPAGNRYKIRRGIAGNITGLDADGREVESLCCHPAVRGFDGLMPAEDVVIAQVLGLRFEEKRFREVANICRYTLAA